MLRAGAIWRYDIRLRVFAPDTDLWNRQCYVYVTSCSTSNTLFHPLFQFKESAILGTERGNAHVPVQGKCHSWDGAWQRPDCIVCWPHPTCSDCHAAECPWIPIQCVFHGQTCDASCKCESTRDFETMIGCRPIVVCCFFSFVCGFSLIPASVETLGSESLKVARLTSSL